MANAVTPTGITTLTQAELLAQFTADFEAIYGSDINLESDSPDGQMINIFIQAILDVENLITQVYNSMDPDLAVGTALDERVALNGIQRQQGTYTITDITVVTDDSVTLPGLDQTDLPPFTVSDAQGNEWNLIATQNPAVAGAYVYSFQSAVLGAVLTTPNTITVQVSVILGVVSVNNPTTYTTLGINEETDAVLKVRRQRSVSLASQGYLAGLLAALENINGVTSAFVYENDTGSPVAFGSDTVPGHSIWVIVAGTATDAEIAQAIYSKRNAGCGMYGSIAYVVTQADGTPFTVYWDESADETIFIKFTATSLDGVNAPNLALIRATLPTLLVPGTNEQLNINDLATLVQQIDNNCLVTAAGFSTSAGGVYTNTLSPTHKYNKFVVSAADIIILPMILSPVTVTVPNTTGTQTFTGLGGYGALVYSFSANVSGGSINAGTGAYTAGAIPGTDIILVTDSLGNTATATVTVT